MNTIILLFLTSATIANALAPLDLLNVVQIFPDEVIKNIPEKITSKIKELDQKRNGLTTSYTFPDNYKSTLYKDYAQKTTLINVFPTMDTVRYTHSFQSIDVQQLETSTTLIYEQMNSTVLYMTTPMLNSTLVYPTTHRVQEFGYVAPEYQHETLVYSTSINVTEVTSTQAMNFTAVITNDNDLPFV